MPLRFRRAAPDDIARVIPLLKHDRPLFAADTWRALPAVLEDLVERECILLCVLQDTSTGRLPFVGGSGFLDDGFLAGAMRDASESLTEQAMAVERRYDHAFLNPVQVARANGRARLHLLNFFGVPFRLDAVGIGTATEAWSFFHKGFQLDDVWCETADAGQAQLYGQMGLRLTRERSSAAGQTVWQFHVTRQEALQMPASWPASAMLSPMPRFGFTRPQQKLLELALLDHSDREIAERLDLSEDAVKKRWRSIYEKVGAVEATLIRADDSGANQRRSLLQRLRQHLEELRPYAT